MCTLSRRNIRHFKTPSPLPALGFGAQPALWHSTWVFLFQTVSIWWQNTCAKRFLFKQNVYASVPLERVAWFSDLLVLSRAALLIRPLTAHGSEGLADTIQAAPGENSRRRPSCRVCPGSIFPDHSPLLSSVPELAEVIALGQSLRQRPQCQPDLGGHWGPLSGLIPLSLHCGTWGLWSTPSSAHPLSLCFLPATRSAALLCSGPSADHARTESSKLWAKINLSAFKLWVLGIFVPATRKVNQDPDLMS